MRTRRRTAHGRLRGTGSRSWACPRTCRPRARTAWRTSRARASPSRPCRHSRMRLRGSWWQWPCPAKTLADMRPQRRFNAPCSLQAFLTELPPDLSARLIAQLRRAGEQQTEMLNDIPQKGIKSPPSQVALPSRPLPDPGARVERARRPACDAPPGGQLGGPRKPPCRGRLLPDQQGRHLAGQGLRLCFWDLPAGPWSSVPQVQCMGPCGLPLHQEPARGDLVDNQHSQAPHDARPCGREAAHLLLGGLLRREADRRGREGARDMATLLGLAHQAGDGPHNSPRRPVGQDGQGLTHLASRHPAPPDRRPKDRGWPGPLDLRAPGRGVRPHPHVRHGLHRPPGLRLWLLAQRPEKTGPDAPGPRRGR